MSNPVAVKAKVVAESTPGGQIEKAIGARDGEDAAKLFSKKAAASSVSDDVKKCTTQAKFGNDSIFARIAYSEKFINTTLAVIVMNALWIGIDTEWNHDNLKTDADGNEIRLELHNFFLAGENFFCIYFVFELVVRFLAFKNKKSAFDLSDKWFIFDSILVTFMVLETWIMPIIEAASGGEGAQMPGLSVFRLLRLLRLTRMARIMRAVPELMTLIKGMVAAVRSASVILFFLLGVMYVFAIVFTSMLSSARPEGTEPGTFWCQPHMFEEALASAPAEAEDGRRLHSVPGSKWGPNGIARALQDGVGDAVTVLPASWSGNFDDLDQNGCIWSLHDDALYEGEVYGGDWTAYTRFSSIGSSMMSLFTNGVLGDNLAWCLVHIKNADMFLYWLFIMFMVLSSMTLLNMLIGVLCDVISQAAEDEKEETQLTKFRESLEESFDTIDASAGTAKNGLITEDEWHEIKQLDMVKASFIELGIGERDLDMHLAQLQETLWQTNDEDDPTSHKKNGLTFDKFYKKIIDLRPETPASALDVEMMKMMVTNNERLIKHQMDKVQSNMMKVVQEKNPWFAPRVDLPKVLPKADPKDKDQTPPWWLKDVSNDLLFQMLKSRENSTANTR